MWYFLTMTMATNQSKPPLSGTVFCSTENDRYFRFFIRYRSIFLPQWQHFFKDFFSWQPFLGDSFANPFLGIFFMNFSLIRGRGVGRGGVPKLFGLKKRLLRRKKTGKKHENHFKRISSILDIEGLILDTVRDCENVWDLGFQSIRWSIFSALVKTLLVCHLHWQRQAGRQVGRRQTPPDLCHCRPS